jgi:NAD-dependent dihydropyrimidine dehydrogenase PreA subunit
VNWAHKCFKFTSSQLTDCLLVEPWHFFHLEQDKLVYCLLGYSPIFVLQILHQKLDKKLVAYAIYACIACTVCSWFFFFPSLASIWCVGVLNLSISKLVQIKSTKTSQKYFSKAVQEFFFPLFCHCVELIFPL